MWLWCKNCMSCLYAKLLVLLKLAPQTSSVQRSHPYLLNLLCVCAGRYLHVTLWKSKKWNIYIYTISIKYCHNWTYIPHLQIPKLIKPSPHDSGACNKLKGLCLSTRYPPKIQRVSYFMFYLTFQKFGASPQHWNKLLCIYKSCVYIYIYTVYIYIFTSHIPAFPVGRRRTGWSYTPTIPNPQWPRSGIHSGSAEFSLVQLLASHQVSSSQAIRSLTWNRNICRKPWFFPMKSRGFL